MEKTRDSLGSYAVGGGTYVTQDGKPTFVMGGLGMGEAINTSMEIKSRKALHGLLSSFFASFIIFLALPILSGWFNNPYLLLAVVYIAYFSFLGWLGAKIAGGSL